MNEKPVLYQQWGRDLDANAVEQMDAARRLPIAARAALMPDAHRGYGLPIGGVLATRNAVIPYAVGVDIACRVKMSVLDLPIAQLEDHPEDFKNAIQTETRFGIGSAFKKHRRNHPVMDEDWSVSPVTQEMKDKAWSQLGTSGSGNHFVEFGVLETPDEGLSVPSGRYLALLSHSGSRGTGANVCKHYSELAMKKCRRDLAHELRHLAWLDLDSEEGEEYWAAMELMGKYAAANHDSIHTHLARALGATIQTQIENHHNFAWKERHGGEELVVHRKGATPAGKGILGVIPGTMATCTHVVRGLGNSASLESAAHGAGRVMSRTKAKKILRWARAKEMLREQGVTLLSAGLDEVPMVYKDIERVMADQGDLVQSVARFQPKLVKMAPAGAIPED